MSVKTLMPFNGLHPFLWWPWLWRWLWRVNALQRAYIISTWFWCWYVYHVKRCQCPLTGLLHFYGTRKSAATLPYCINVLQRAASISTALSSQIYEAKIKGVNALQRAASISTLPLGKPLFIRLWRVRFPQDFFNCYKSVTFWHFFVFTKFYF